MSNTNYLLETMRSIYRSADDVNKTAGKISSNNPDVAKLIEDMITYHCAPREHDIYTTTSRRQDVSIAIIGAFVVGYLLRVGELEGSILARAIKEIEPSSKVVTIPEFFNDLVSDEDLRKLEKIIESFKRGDTSIHDLTNVISTISN